MPKVDQEKDLVNMNCPNCKEVGLAKKAPLKPGSTHTVRYICQKCSHSWVVSLGGSFDPSQL